MIENSTDKCTAGSTLESKYDDEVQAVNQNAKLVLDGMERKKSVSCCSITFTTKFASNVGCNGNFCIKFYFTSFLEMNLYNQ